MQDWEWIVADSNRIEEFFNVYTSGNISDDEKFTLMETIFQSVEDSEHALQNYETWKRILESIENNWPLHLYLVWYWSNWENDDENDQWKITPYLRKIFLKHKNEIDGDRG